MRKDGRKVVWFFQKISKGKLPPDGVFRDVFPKKIASGVWLYATGVNQFDVGTTLSSVRFATS